MKVATICFVSLFLSVWALIAAVRTRRRAKARQRRLRNTLREIYTAMNHEKS